AAPERRHLPRMHAAPKTRSPPQCAGADEIEHTGEIEWGHDPGVIRPGGGGPEQVIREPVGSRGCGHRRKREGKEETHRRHPSRKTTATPCITITSANSTPPKAPRPAAKPC